MSTLPRNTWFKLLLCFTAVTVVLFYRFLFGDELFMFTRVGSDTYYQYWPFNHLFADMLQSGRITNWSFHVGLGKQINVLNACLNPYLLFIYLVPSSVQAHAMVYKAILEYFVATVAWGAYLQAIGIRKSALVIGALFFGFNGYITLWGQHDTFGVVFTLVPLTLYAFEHFLKTKRFMPLVASLTLFLCCSYYFFYMFSIFFLFFSLCRYVAVRDWQPKEAILTYLKLGGCYVLAFLLSAWSIAPTVAYLTTSPRIGADTHTRLLSMYSLMQYVATILRLFSNNIFGAGLNYRGPPNYYEMPQLYCGILTLLVIPQFFIFVRKRERVVVGCAAGVLLLSMLSPYVALLFNGVSTISYRQSFLLIVLALYMAAHALHNIMSDVGINRRLLVLTCVVLCLPAVGTLIIAPLIMFDVVSLPENMLDHSLIMMRSVVPGSSAGDLVSTLKGELLPRMMREMGIVLCFLLGYTFLLFHYSSVRKKRIAVVLIAMVVCEIVVFTYPTVNDRVTLKKTELKNRTGYFDYTREALARIRESDNSFYRVFKTYNSVFLCDSMMQGYYGTKSYCSVQEPAKLNFLSKMEVQPFLPGRTKFIGGFNNRYILNTLMGVKYILSREAVDTPGYELVEKVHDINIYRNIYALPLGVAFEQYLDEPSFMLLPLMAKDSCLLNACVLGGDAAADPRDQLQMDLVRFDPRKAQEGQNADQAYSAAATKLQGRAFTITRFKEDHIAGNITTDGDAILFFSIPWNAGWQARVDGKPQSVHKINMGFLGLPLKKGTHTVEISFTPYGRRTGFAITAGTALAVLLALLLAHTRRRKREF